MLKRKKDDGFTLIELMIVIAVIGILAVVLVPKMGNVKTSAKLTGVQTNYQSVLAGVQSLNTLSSTNVLGSGTGSLYDGVNNFFNTNNAIRNPITNTVGVTTATDFTAAATVATAGAAVAVNSNATTASVTSLPTNTAFAGMVVLNPYVTNNIVYVQVVGYDDTGKPISGLSTTLQP